MEKPYIIFIQASDDKFSVISLGAMRCHILLQKWECGISTKQDGMKNAA